MMFACIRQEVDYSMKKSDRKDGNVDYAPTSRVYTMLFFINFVSVWFEHYSKYFAGERLEKVQGCLDKPFQKLYKIRAINLISNTLYHVFFMA